MGSLYHLRAIPDLAVILEGSMVNDNELWMLLRGNSLKYLDISGSCWLTSGCPLITADCFKKLIGCDPTSIETLCIAKTSICQEDMPLVIEITRTRRLMPEPECSHLRSLITSNILTRENGKS